MRLERIEKQQSGVKQKGGQDLPDLRIVVRLEASESALIRQLLSKKHQPVEGLHARLGNYKYHQDSDRQVTFTIFAESQQKVFDTTDPKRIAITLIDLFRDNLKRLSAKFMSA